MPKDIRIPKKNRYEIFVRSSDLRPEEKIAEIASPGLTILLLENLRRIYPPDRFTLRVVKNGVYNPDGIVA